MYGEVVGVYGEVVGVHGEVGVGERGGTDVVLWPKSGQKWPKPVLAEKSI